MAGLLSSGAASLKTLLLGLRPTGQDGFEGLMASVLTEIAGIPFRVASSGPQFGSDGDSAGKDECILFECKRYRDEIPRKEIRSKLAELALRSATVDAWILCATSAVSSQTAHDVQELGRQFGIATLILDWTGQLPTLAVALAMATDATRHLVATDSSAAAALEAISANRGFVALAGRLRRDLDEPLVGARAARQANAAWLVAAFACRKCATLAFGEPLSPLDETHGRARPRADLVARVRPFLNGETAPTTLCVLGGEGAGKSWLVANAWCREDEVAEGVIDAWRQAGAS